MLRLSGATLLIWMRILSHISCHPSFESNIEPSLSVEQLEEMKAIENELLESVEIYSDPVTMGIEAKTSSDVAEVRSKQADLAADTCVTSPESESSGVARADQPYFRDAPAMEGVLVQNSNLVIEGNPSSGVSHIARSLYAQLSHGASDHRSSGAASAPTRNAAAPAAPVAPPAMSAAAAPVSNAGAAPPTDEEMQHFFELYDSASANASQPRGSVPVSDQSACGAMDELEPLKRTIAELIEFVTRDANRFSPAELADLTALQTTLNELTANVAALDERSRRLHATAATPGAPSDVLKLVALTEAAGHLSAKLDKYKIGAAVDEQAEVNALQASLSALADLAAQEQAGAARTSSGASASSARAPPSFASSSSSSSSDSARPAASHAHAATSGSAAAAQTDVAAAAVGAASETVPPVIITRATDPVNEFADNDYLYLSAFSPLFILGRKIPGTGSLPAAFIRHCLLQYDQRFSQSHEFILLAMNQYQARARRAETHVHHSRIFPTFTQCLICFASHCPI
jgi:hypothetical protein